MPLTKRRKTNIGRGRGELTPGRGRKIEGRPIGRRGRTPPPSGGAYVGGLVESLGLPRRRIGGAGRKTILPVGKPTPITKPTPRRKRILPVRTRPSPMGKRILPVSKPTPIRKPAQKSIGRPKAGEPAGRVSIGRPKAPARPQKSIGRPKAKPRKTKSIGNINKMSPRPRKQRKLKRSLR